MNEFIQMVTSSLGTSEGTARSATGSLLGFIRDQVGNAEFSQLAQKLPGATDLLQSGATQATGESGGLGDMLGGLAGKVASSVSGDLGSAAGLAGMLKGSGLELDQTGSFVTMFVDFARDKIGPELVDGLLKKLPELKKLLG
jgi:hypothetical protein